MLTVVCRRSPTYISLMPGHWRHMSLSLYRMYRTRRPILKFSGGLEKVLRVVLGVYLASHLIPRAISCTQGRKALWWNGISEDWEIMEGHGPWGDMMEWIIRQQILYNALDLSSRTAGLYNYCCVSLQLLLWTSKKDGNEYSVLNLTWCFLCRLHAFGIKPMSHFHYTSEWNG